MDHPTKTYAWKELTEQADQSAKPSPEHNYYAVSQNIALDYSGQCINDSILNSLIALAQQCHLQTQIDALFNGHPVNNTENRPALHTALRSPKEMVIQVNQANVVAEVEQTRQRMAHIATQIRQGEWYGYSGKAITDVVNIGIGGSMLGPFFCLDALQVYVTQNIKFHFISEMDPNIFSRVCKHLNPETTLFLISSKSFTTPETLYHMKNARAWINQETNYQNHFIAITANIKQAQEYGFKHILPIWDWVGGRYSACSSINLITCIAIGYEAFSDLLLGAHEMDMHFKQTDFIHNLPVLLALLGIWNINFLKSNNLLILTYAEDLKYFVPYLQQLDMESNGKSINKQGLKIDYDTGPIIWGGSGNQAQHSYYQLLCQGTRQIAADLISVETFDHELINKICHGHKKVLTQGVSSDSNPYNHIAGKRPINHLSLIDCSPKTLGALIALYEHKIFVQGVIWNINPFDQPGVESSKNNLREFA